MTTVPDGHAPQAVKQEVRHRWWWVRETRPRRLLLLIGSVVALAVIAGLGLLSIQNPVFSSDVWATHELQEINLPGAYELLRVVSLPGYPPWSVIIVGLGTLLVAWRFERRAGFYLLALTLVQGVANSLIKAAVGRPRPTADLVEVFFPNSGSSFPSGHVMFYTIFFGFLLFLLWSRLGRSLLRTLLLLLLGALIVLVGPSRLYLGAHWLSDVIAAYLVGLLFLLPGIELYIARIAPPTHEIATKADQPTGAGVGISR